MSKRSRLTGISTKPIDADAMKKAIKEHNRLRDLWRSRKSSCVDAIDALSEGMNKAPKAIFAELELERDEDHGQQVPAAIPEPRK